MESKDNYLHLIHLNKNGIAKRRNRSITEATRAMLIENDVPKTFWREIVNIEVYTLK